MRGLALTGALLIAGGVSLFPAGTPGQPVAGRMSCSPLDYGVSLADARSGPGETVVPAVLHMMAADVPSHHAGWPADPLSDWTPEVVRHFFGPEGLVNKRVWAKHGIRLAVVQVDKCPYAPATLRPDRKAEVSVPNPEESVAAMRFFHRINRLYSSADTRVLNVYLWVKVGETSTASAYGTSLKQETSAVWADRFCVLADDPSTREDERVMRPVTCARKLAHEIGHALTLPHTCRRSDTGAPPKDAHLPTCDGTEEPAALRDNLMRAVEQGDDLTDSQVRAAKAWAKQHYSR